MKLSHPIGYFNNILVSSNSVHKHLQMLLDDKLNNKHHFKFVLNKVKNKIGLLRKFQQSFQIQIYKSLIQLRLNYGDIVCDQAFNESFYEKIKSIQYNTVIVATGEIRGRSSEKFF